MEEKSDSDDRDNRDKKDLQSQQEENLLIVKVRSALVGCIIGQGGSNIKQLENESGAKIKVTNKINYIVNISLMNVNNCLQIVTVLENDAKRLETSFQITGDPEKAKEAERLIKKIVEEYKEGK